MKKTTVSLYPGFLTKSQSKVFWHPLRPEYSELSDIWTGEKMIEVTSCIHDPWPHTEGGKDCILELE